MNTMDAKNAIAGSMAQCVIALEGNQYNFAQAINLEASIEKNKTDVPILGKTGKGHKATGWSGSGKATFHYNTSFFRKMLLEYKKTGKDMYFDMIITNEDPSSNVGKQIITLKSCNVDGGILAKFDADADYLDEDMDFTFEDYDITEEFATLERIK